MKFTIRQSTHITVKDITSCDYKQFDGFFFFSTYKSSWLEQSCLQKDQNRSIKSRNLRQRFHKNSLLNWTRQCSAKILIRFNIHEYLFAIFNHNQFVVTVQVKECRYQYGILVSTTAQFENSVHLSS